uniref:Ribosome biogenesis regulatory protein n=1 Tax=Clastoptera arizonana TaxID=38151 RepID=A0A1B6D477_9HEMI
MDVVSEAFLKAEKNREKFKPITVEKLIDLDYDLGTLLALDTNDLDTKQLRSNKEKYLLNLARDNTQLLLNTIWELPAERVEDAIVVKLPAPTYILPREKPAPKPKPLTRWQKFAIEKGIKKTKKAKATWDDILKKWVPLHGFKRAAAEKEKNWLLEVPQNADPYVDRFELEAKTKQEKVAKNEFQRLRNLAAAKSIKVPRVGLPPTEKLSSEQLKTATVVAKVSTASIGKFQPRLAKEKDTNLQQTKLLPGNKKRKHIQLRSDQEKANNMSILDSIINKRPKLDIEKAVNQKVFSEDQTQQPEKRQNKGKGKKRTTFGGKKGRGAGKRSAAKPVAGKGNRNRMVGGRKRR